MKKLLSVAVLSLASMGRVIADDGAVAPLLGVQDAPVPVAPAVVAGSPLKSPLGVDGNLAGQAYEVRGYGDLLSPPVGEVLASQGAGVVGEAKIGPGGVYQIPGLRPGLYTIVINTPQGFAATGAYVDVNGSGPGPLGLETGLVPPADFGFVREVVMSTPSSGLDAAGGQVLPAEIVNQLSRDGAFTLAADGSVAGYMAVPGAIETRAADHMLIWLVRDGAPVASGESDAMGYFRLGGLQPGWYTLVASGKYGFAAKAVEVSANTPVADALDTAIAAPTQRVLQGGQLVAVIPGSDANLIRNRLPNPSMFARAGGAVPGQMFPGGGFGGGGFGGGGFGGPGLGGLGALLGAAGLAAGIVALADDDDKIIIISPPGP